MGGSAFGPQDAGPPVPVGTPLKFLAHILTIGPAHEAFRSSVGQRAQTEVGGPASVAFRPSARAIGYAVAARRIRLVA
jgi:hypothetical protein